MAKDYFGYRRTIILQLRARQKKDPSYSLRSFARDLEVDAAAICRILKGQQEPSITMTSQLAKQLGLGRQAKVDFIESILYEHTHKKRIAMYEACGLGFEYAPLVREWVSDTK